MRRLVHRSGRRIAAVLAGALCLSLAGAAPADDLGDDDPYYGIEDPWLRKLLELDRLAPFEDKAPLWSHFDAALQDGLEDALARMGLGEAVQRRKLGVALVDITRLDAPRVAAVNGDEMMYAASLPKIAILLAAFEKIAEGGLALDAPLERQLTAMIRESSNHAATAVMHRVGKKHIARVLLSPRYRLYHPAHNGGLWCGKDYASAGLWRRDPMYNLSHGATAMQVARFYYLLETGNLVTPEHSRKMKEILSRPGIEHKFVRGIKRVRPHAALYRKSGSWRTWHSDSAIVERPDGTRYIAVGLFDSPSGSAALQQLIVELDRLVDEGRWQRRAGGPGLTVPGAVLP